MIRPYHRSIYWQDGPWYNQILDYHTCNDGQQITSITCN